MNRSNLRRFGRYWFHLSGQAGRVIAAYGLSVLGVGLSLALPWPMKLLIDDVLVGHSTFPILSEYSATSQVILIALSMFVLALVSAVLLAIEKVQHARVREHFGFGLRDELIQQIYRLSRFSRQGERSGELTMRLSGDIQQVSRLFCKTAPNILKLTAITVFSLLAIFSISLPLGAFSLMLAGVLTCLVVWFGPKVNAASRHKRQLDGSVASLTQETIRAIEHVQAMGLEKQGRERYLKEAAASLAAGVNETRVAVHLERATQIIAGLALACVAGVGGLMVLNDQLTLGLLTVCLAYINALLKPIEKINELAMSVSQGLVRVERIEQVFAAETSIGEAEVGTAYDELLSIETIECVDVAYTYPDSRHRVVSQFGHRFVKGESTLLVGPSGSGKSTVLRLILRLLSPDTGLITAGGRNYSEIDPAELRSQCAVVMQDAHLYAGTLRAVLTELAPNADDEQLRDALEQVGLLPLVDSMKSGLDSPMDETGSQLSGGQKTRMLLARALLSNRPVLILDEPFANIDEESKRVITSRLADYKRHCILIVVTHENVLLEIADHILTPTDWGSTIASQESVNA